MGKKFTYSLDTSFLRSKHAAKIVIILGYLRKMFTNQEQIKNKCT